MHLMRFASPPPPNLRTIFRGFVLEDRVCLLVDSPSPPRASVFSRSRPFLRGRRREGEEGWGRARRKIECEHGRSICPKEPLIFGRCTPTTYLPRPPPSFFLSLSRSLVCACRKLYSEQVVQEERTGKGEKGRERRAPSLPEPERRSDAAHNKADRAPLMRHNGTGEYA